jgi:hypothetical protein
LLRLTKASRMIVDIYLAQSKVNVHDLQAAPAG